IVAGVDIRDTDSAERVSGRSLADDRLMPVEQLLIGPTRSVRWNVNPWPIERVVTAVVVTVCPQGIAAPRAIARRDARVTAVVKTLEIAAQQNYIGFTELAAL